MEIKGKPLSYSSFRFWAGFIKLKFVGSGFLTELWRETRTNNCVTCRTIYIYHHQLKKKKKHVRKKLKCFIYRDLEACLKTRFEVLQSTGFFLTSVIYYSCKTKQDFTTHQMTNIKHHKQTENRLMWFGSKQLNSCENILSFRVVCAQPNWD